MHHRCGSNSHKQERLERALTMSWRGTCRGRMPRVGFQFPTSLDLERSVHWQSKRTNQEGKASRLICVQEKSLQGGTKSGAPSLDGLSAFIGNIIR